MNISVVIPVYNAKRYLERCIEALLSQSYPKENYEIIMIDNCSTDDSAAIIRKYPFVKLLSENKQGAYAARNRGVSASNGKVIAFTDPDCIPCTDWLQNISTAMGSSDIEIVMGCREPHSNSPALSMVTSYENTKNGFVFNSNSKDLYYGYTNNMAVRSELFEELGLFIERHRGSDTIFVRLVVEKHSVNSVRYCPNVRVKHMELDSLWSYYCKMFIYGRSRRMYKQISYTRSLNNSERCKIFKKTIHRNSYELIRPITLFFLLNIGLVFWSLGSLIGAWSLKRKVR